MLPFVTAQRFYSEDFLRKSPLTSFMTEKLKFKPVLTNTKLDLGSPGKIACHAEGRSAPSIRWLKDGHSDLPSYIHDVEGVLHIRSVHYSDAGNYTCIATNEQGTINTTIRVDIVGQ